jgi:integrase
MDRAEAEKLGTALLAALLRNEQVESSGALTLSALWERYSAECVAFQDYSDRMRQESEGRVKILLGFFGADCDVRGLSAEDQSAYAKKRLAGGIIYGADKHGRDKQTPAVRARSVQADIEVLRHMLHWATTVRVRGGVRLLDRNPLESVKLPGRGTNPRRPVASHDRFRATRGAIVKLQEEARTDAERRKWLKLEIALVLAQATGRRLGSIRQLAWNDIDFTANWIRWRAEADKKGREWKIPMHESLRDELKHFRVRMGGAFEGLLFPSDNDSAVAVRRDVLGAWLLQAEKKAGLAKLDGSLWHSYRRAWATSRKDLPTADVAAAGGWSDVGTLLRCYQQPDDATMLEVMSHDRKVLERVSGTN